MSPARCRRTRWAASGSAVAVLERHLQSRAGVDHLPERRERRAEFDREQHRSQPRIVEHGHEPVGWHVVLDHHHDDLARMCVEELADDAHLVDHASRRRARRTRGRGTRRTGVPAGGAPSRRWTSVAHGHQLRGQLGRVAQRARQVGVHPTPSRGTEVGVDLETPGCRARAEPPSCDAGSADEAVRRRRHRVVGGGERDLTERATHTSRRFRCNGRRSRRALRSASRRRARTRSRRPRPR